jgi:hypothetical protein
MYFFVWCNHERNSESLFTVLPCEFESIIVCTGQWGIRCLDFPFMCSVVDRQTLSFHTVDRRQWGWNTETSFSIPSYPPPPSGPVVSLRQDVMRLQISSGTRIEQQCRTVRAKTSPKHKTSLLYRKVARKEIQKPVFRFLSRLLWRWLAFLGCSTVYYGSLSKFRRYLLSPSSGTW